MDWINAFGIDLIDLDQDRLDLDLDLDPGSTRELLAKFAKYLQRLVQKRT